MLSLSYFVSKIHVTVVKVDVSNAGGQQTKEKNHKKTVSNSLSLVRALFEEDICLVPNINVDNSGDFPV
jgi:hypothetical protein